MKLSELITGQEAEITKINGKGEIIKRINEMGFIPGRRIKAIKSAPLKDPIEYDLMGYKLSIRRKEAAMIEVETDLVLAGESRPKSAFSAVKDMNTHVVRQNNTGQKSSRHIKIALVGNPNCGKTTLFNFATNSRERVANYSGVTVAAKEASLEFDGYTMQFIDLPGTYSLSPYSPEEMFVTDYLLNHKPDLIINVVDAGNLERNLYLTTQIIDTGIPTVVALNMYDEFKANAFQLDHNKLGTLLGTPFVPTIGTKGKGLKPLFKRVIKIYQNQDETIRSVNIPMGREIEEAISSIENLLSGHPDQIKNSNRLLATQILEGDPIALPSIAIDLQEKLTSIAREHRKKIEQLLPSEINTEILNRRYGFIEGALAETQVKKIKNNPSLSQRIDQVLTHRLLGLPVFFGIIWLIFFFTFKIGEYPMGWIEQGVGSLSQLSSQLLPEGAFSQLITDGVIGGVGGVLVFLPNIMILFFMISLLEDSGYMARTAFLMDKVMHKAGLHGKSFIPLLMGFGCNVPAIMATRTIESKRDRLLTMLITPFMSCSARLPVYVLFISAFFPLYQSALLFSMYLIGILAALVTAVIMNKTMFKKVDSPFVMELPPYRLPTMKAIGKHTWFKTSHFLKKMGTIILFASIIVWALGYFPRDKEIISRYDQQINKQQEQLAVIPSENSNISMQIKEKIDNLDLKKNAALLEQSYISQIGKTIEPVFKPLGFDWRMSVSILTGIMAKEVVVSSMGLLYQADSEANENSPSLIRKLQSEQKRNHKPLIAYFGFLVFTLLYFPCMGTLVAIKKETAKWGWTLFSAFYPLVFAWIITFGIYQIGRLLI